ncbi:hypothetical protein [Bacillus phage SPO1L1]|nr:hypothetical protein [Bacillus phage SPO1L1]WIT26081.1 hypothetical protein [Bacillus phage SPO1L2]
MSLKKLISPGDKYVHYNNNMQYVVLGVSKNATNGFENEEESVSYLDVLTGTLYHRKISEFLSEAEKEMQKVKRFIPNGYANVHFLGQKGEVVIEQLFIRG